LTQKPWNRRSSNYELDCGRAGAPFYPPLGEDRLEENIKAFVDAVLKAKPEGAKGAYVKKVSLSSTMGPGVQVDLGSITGAE